TEGESSILDIFTFANNNGIKELQSREQVYQDFVEQFSKFFNRTDSVYNNFKGHYIKSIENLGDLVNKASGIFSEKKQFTNYGKDSESIKLTMYEDNYLNTGYLAMLYNTMVYSKLNGKQLIPENLLRFD